MNISLAHLPLSKPAEKVMPYCKKCHDEAEGTIRLTMAGQCQSNECYGDGTTSYSCDKFCEKCSEEKNVCEYCGEQITPNIVPET